MAKASSQNTMAKFFMYLSLIAAAVLLLIGGLGLWAGLYTGNMVRTELAAQKIYFPEKEKLDPKTYPDLQQYAGQLVDTPAEARAYANGYIGRHLKNVADGKVYAEVSAEAMKDPANQKLQQQKASLFQGETLRGMLLANGYGFGTVGKVATIVGYVALVGSAVMLILALAFRSRSRKG